MKNIMDILLWRNLWIGEYVLKKYLHIHHDISSGVFLYWKDGQTVLRITKEVANRLI